MTKDLRNDSNILDLVVLEMSDKVVYGTDAVESFSFEGSIYKAIVDKSAITDVTVDKDDDTKFEVAEQFGGDVFNSEEVATDLEVEAIWDAQ